MAHVSDRLSKVNIIDEDSVEFVRLKVVTPSGFDIIFDLPESSRLDCDLFWEEFFCSVWVGRKKD